MNSEFCFKWGLFRKNILFRKYKHVWRMFCLQWHVLFMILFRTLPRTIVLSSRTIMASVSDACKRKLDVVDVPKERKKVQKVEAVSKVFAMGNYTVTFDLQAINYDETEYYFEGCLRKVYPYYYVYQAHCKGRWIGSKLIDVMKKEFRSLPDSSLVS